MKKLWTIIAFAAAIFLGSSVRSFAGHYYRIVSPDHEQTFACGTEQSRIWVARGADKHLVVLLNFTNDPYFDRVNQRQYDNFTFSFPHVILGSDGHTFYYHGVKNGPIPVAERKAGFLGIKEIKLLPNAELIVHKPHGMLMLELIVEG